MTRAEACELLTETMTKVLKDAHTREELALTGILALVVASVKTAMTMEMMTALHPFAMYVKGRIDEREKEEGGAKGMETPKVEGPE